MSMVRIAFAIEARLARPGFTLDVAFAAPPGLTVVFGPSGAGKTTFLELVAGIVRPDSGCIAVAGTTLFDAGRGVDLAMRRRGLGYVPQDIALFPHLDAAANLAYAAKGRRGDDFAAVVEMLELGALLDRRPAALSGGEQRRVALGRALLAKPRALLLDEPLAGLDPPRRRRLLPYIERVRRNAGLPILYVSHYAEEVIRLADWAVMLDRGRVIASGAAEDVFANPEAQAHFGPFDLGAIVAGTVTATGAVEVVGGEIKLAPGAATPGTVVRLRILARDVALALTPPRDTSLQNILPCRIDNITTHGADGVLVQLSLGLDGAGEHLQSLVTPASVARLGLAPGRPLYALVKAVAVTPGRRPPPS